MDHRKIGDKARVWVVTRAVDGSIVDEVDPGLLAKLRTDDSATKLTDPLAIAAGEMELGAGRLW